MYGPTKKSEITYADCDSSWEVALAQHLDEMDEITRWARNKGLNWSIPYVVDRQQKRYFPDFVAVVRIQEGLELNIVIETKGLVREYDPIKRRWAQEYWVPAVNRHPDYGTGAGKAVGLPLPGQRSPCDTGSRKDSPTDRERERRISNYASS